MAHGVDVCTVILVILNLRRNHNSRWVAAKLDWWLPVSTLHHRSVWDLHIVKVWCVLHAKFRGVWCILSSPRRCRKLWIWPSSEISVNLLPTLHWLLPHVACENQCVICYSMRNLTLIAVHCHFCTVKTTNLTKLGVLGACIPAVKVYQAQTYNARVDP